METNRYLLIVLALAVIAFLAFFMVKREPQQSTTEPPKITTPAPSPPSP